MSKTDRRQLVLLRTRFVRDMLQTRDVKPLLKTYFAKDFATCLRKPPADEDLKDMRLSDAEWQRVMVDSMNWYYAAIVLFIYNEGGGHVPDTLPKFENVYDPFPDDSLKDPALFLKAATRVEGDLAQVRRFLRLKNIEQSKAFRRVLSKRASDGTYEVESRFDANERDLFWCWKPNSDPKHQLFRVWTPLDLLVHAVKENGRFRFVLFGPSD